MYFSGMSSAWEYYLYYDYLFLLFQVLSKFDNSIRDQYLTVVCRIYAVFESIHRFATHLNGFIRDLKEGVFLHTTTETVFADHDGKQLMVGHSLCKDILPTKKEIQINF